MRIRSHLLLLVLAVVIPAFLSAALGIGYIYTETQESYRQSMRETTRALALVLDKETAKRETILRALAASPVLHRGDLQTFYELARRIAPTPDTTIILSNAAGQLLLNTRLPFGAQQPIVAAIPELRKEHGPDKTLVSNVYFAPVGKRYSFSVEIPVKRGDRTLYYLEFGGYASHLQTVFEEQQLPPLWTGTIVDRNAVIVARSKQPETYVGMPVKDGLITRFAADAEGFREGAVTLSGEPVVAFFSRAPQSGWRFIVSVPQSELRRTAINAAAIVGAVSLLFFGLAIAGALAFARTTVRPVEALRLSAERLGRGEPVTAAPSGLIEMDAVASAMVRASEEIRNNKSELERQVAEAVAAAERSERAMLQGQKLEALGRLTGGIAHDFNNVLQTLTTGLDMAHHSSDDDRVRSTLEACQRAVDRAGELTRQLMAFGRVQDARLETVDLPRQIAAMTPLLKGALRSDIALQLDIADGLWPVTFDPLQFELALLNLSINACHAMPRGGLVRLEARNETLTEADDVQASDGLAPGEYVRLSVIDCGEGMTAEVLARAFDPFFTTKSVSKGSGLGLPQAYGFAKQTGGALILRSTPGEGTAATLYLPKADRPAEALKADKRMPGQSAAGEVVLFVEDDALVRDVVRPALEASGFTVIAANDGEEAVARLEAGERIDLVFSDIVMPGHVSGIDLAKIIRARFPEVCVVLATGYSDRRVLLPDVRTLAKPYNVRDIVEALKDQLEVRKAPRVFRVL